MARLRRLYSLPAVLPLLLVHPRASTAFAGLPNTRSLVSYSRRQFTTTPAAVFDSRLNSREVDEFAINMSSGCTTKRSRRMPSSRRSNMDSNAASSEGEAQPNAGKRRKSKSSVKEEEDEVKIERSQDEVEEKRNMKSTQNDVQQDLLGATLVEFSGRLHSRLKDYEFKGTSKQPVTCSYNVLEYASHTFEMYTRRYGGRSMGRVLVVGMNPGPWGMVQTGVPFGEVGFVRDWLGVEGQVGRPSKEHAKRPVEGFECRRSEVSGKRLWGFFERRFGTADKWGDKMFAYNYCPLTFMGASGGNITPDKLPPGERKMIGEACGEALEDTISALRPCVIVGVGTFAGGKCLEALKASRLGEGPGEKKVEVVIVNHPSPASPSGIKWEKATCMDELILASSLGKEIDRFLA